MADNNYSYKAPSYGGGGKIYHKTLAKLVDTNNGSNVQNMLDSHENHVNNKNNPHGITLSQLGYDQVQKDLIKDLINLFFPVNCIKITYTPTNPGTTIPGTTWELVSQGRFLKGASSGDTNSKTGGSSTVNIAHTHSISAHTHSIDSHNHAIGSHSHGLSSHSHSIGSHTHSIDSHFHTVDSHTHTVYSHKHLQTVGSDDTYIYVKNTKSGTTSDTKVTTATNIRKGISDWTHQVNGPVRFHYTSTSDDASTSSSNPGTNAKSLTTNAATGSTGGSGDLTTGSSTPTCSNTALTTNGTSLTTNSSGGDITINPPFQTMYIWRRTA